MQRGKLGEQNQEKRKNNKLNQYELATRKNFADICRTGFIVKRFEYDSDSHLQDGDLEVGTTEPDSLKRATVQ